ncbi:unnamed protein product [Ambrosiozyma monospora]|uniref:Unnamed protein product n=1 Tax=Ambrosiozyma monospora TaxID=43982 RepID=A0A9W6YWW1_AMBMO|nr:unnamed protein product [Ambrosiozyma monospora]
MLIISTLSIPVSVLFRKPFEDLDMGTYYTGLSWTTFKENLYPNFTKGAAGSQLNGVENFNDLFGIFFPATAGILAGASMSGDLKNPSKSIPKGTLDGLLVTFTCYFLVIISMGSAIPRDFLYKDVQVIQTVNLSPIVILLGEMSTSIFSVIVGIVGAAKLLQAIARDEILPGLKMFGIGNKVDDPIYGIIFTWLLCQLFLFADINQIAGLITMAFLMTFIVTNLACFFLKVASAPNFRPSFKYFNTRSAFIGTVLSGVAMFIVDGMSASLIFIMLMSLLLCIHYVSPPKQWGDVSQSLIYHQVRKYLLKLRQDNVKYWRPQVLLLVDNPRTSFKLISFCNHLKKGGLYVLGHVMVSKTFQDRLGDLNNQKQAWLELRDIAKLKAFIQISVAPSFVWGVRNVFLGSGLGGMKPNITIIGFYDLSVYTSRLPKGVKFENASSHYNRQVNESILNLPTDSLKTESKLKLTDWVQVLEDLSLLNSNIAVAKGFPRLHIPSDNESKVSQDQKKFIDLYPIQMASTVVNLTGDQNILTTNFDTCTLILQLGAILNTVPSWKKTHRLRVVVFVEYENAIDEERERVSSLLEILRIEATILVLCLNTGNFASYNYILKGESTHEPAFEKKIDNLLEDDEWWRMLKGFRMDEDHVPIFTPARTRHVNTRVVSKIAKSSKIRYNSSKLNKLGVSLSFIANKISKRDINRTLDDDPSDDDVYASDAESIMSFTSTKSATSVTSPLLKPTSNLSSASLQNDLSSTAHHLRRPLLQTLKSSSSIRRGKSTMGFSADTMPNSQIFENAQGNEPSVGFVHDDVSSVKSRSISMDMTSPTKEPGFKSDISKKPLSVRPTSSMSSLRNMMTGSASQQQQNISTTKSKADSSEVQQQPQSLLQQSQPLLPPPSNPPLPQPHSALPGISESTTAYDNLVFSFNEASNKSQFLILNELMAKTSTISDTALIFSTLPIPDVGLHKSEADCLEYVTNLNLWCDGLPPIMLINSKTMTVTTNL